LWVQPRWSAVAEAADSSKPRGPGHHSFMVSTTNHPARGILLLPGNLLLATMESKKRFHLQNGYYQRSSTTPTVQKRRQPVGLQTSGIQEAYRTGLGTRLPAGEAG